MKTRAHKNALAITSIFFIGGLLFILISNIHTRVALENEVSQQTSIIKNASALSYTPLAGIRNLTQDGSNTNMLETLQFIFKWGIAIAVLLAVLMTIFGGIQYMTSDAIFNKEEGKHKIQSAIMGLLLALSAWIILYTINPRILEKPQSQLLK